MRVFITGGTGLVGTPLVQRLRQRHDEVVLLTRRQAFARERFGNDCTIVEGDPTHADSWMAAISDCDAVINLAGENIFHHRWNEEFKTLLRDSRLKSTSNVVQALVHNPSRASGTPKVLVNASAIGFYGPHGDEVITEESPPGDDFLAQLCVDWGQAARSAEVSSVRVVTMRTGLVLDRSGGALPQLLTPFKMFVGGPFGSGSQWVSWVHHDDLTGLYLFALDNTEAHGPINGTSPNPVINREFTHALGGALHRPSFLRTPHFALRLMLGDVADVITSGQRVLPRKAEMLGYSFRFPQIDRALIDVLSSSQQAAA